MQQINIECIRDVLKYLINNLKIEIEIGRNKFTYTRITTLDLIEKLKSDKYTSEDIIYSINLLSEREYITGNRLQNKTGVYCAEQEIISITYNGQKFYESIKPEDVWNKTKNIIQKIGVHTLEFIESTAHDMAVESAKQATAQMMGSTYPTIPFFQNQNRC